MAQRGGKRVGAGRKKGIASILAEKVRGEIAKAVDRNHKPIIKKAIEDAKNGDKYAREWLYDQAFGKPKQPLAGVDGESLFPTDAERALADKAIEEM